MASYKYIGGNDGLWTDPQNWDTGTVPLWDAGSDVQLGGSGVTLHDIEPNNMTVDAGAASAGSNGAITLDNAAFGPSLLVEVASTAPATRVSPFFYSDAGAGIEVVGYDTNYGTIEVRHDQSSNGGYFLGFTVDAGSQLNNLGTITADGQISGHSNETHLLFENGPGQSSGVLDNDGQVNVLDDTVAFIGLAVVGSGTITLARPDGNFNANYPSLVMSGPVAATQTVELDAGQLGLSQAADQPLQFQATIAGWNAEGEVILPYPFHGDSLTYLPSSPGHGDLVVSGSVTNAGATDRLSYDLHLAGNYATSDFILGPGPGPNPSGTIISIRA